METLVKRNQSTKSLSNITNPPINYQTLIIETFVKKATGSFSDNLCNKIIQEVENHQMDESYLLSSTKKTLELHYNSQSNSGSYFKFATPIFIQQTTRILTYTLVLSGYPVKSILIITMLIDFFSTVCQMQMKSNSQKKRQEITTLELSKNLDNSIKNTNGKVVTNKNAILFIITELYPFVLRFIRNILVVLLHIN